MKRLALTLLLFIPVLILAIGTDETQPGLGGSGMFGTYTMGGQTYTRMRLMPEFTLGKFGVGLDLDFMINADGNLRTQDWDEGKDLINKIYYLRWSERGDVFYAKVGGFDSYSLGQGLVVNGYSNMLNYPSVRKIGAMVGVNIAPLYNTGLEVFDADLAENDVLAARATVKPLSDTGLPILSQLTLGGTIAYDDDQTKGLPDSDSDNYYDAFDDFPDDDAWHNACDKQYDYWRSVYKDIVGSNNYSDEAFTAWFDSTGVLHRNPSKSDFAKNSAAVWAVDYELPLYSSDLLTVTHYAEYAKIQDHGGGFIFPGFGMQLSVLYGKLEFRRYEKDFAPGYFDSIYENDRARAYTVSDSTVIVFKEDTLPQVASKGWYGAAGFELLGTITMSADYEDMYYDSNDLGLDHRRGVSGRLGLVPNRIPKISVAQVSYSQSGENHLLKYGRTPNTILTAKAGYEVATSTSLVYSYQETYQDYDGNGKIQGKDEIIKTFNLGVEFHF